MAVTEKKICNVNNFNDNKEVMIENTQPFSALGFSSDLYSSAVKRRQSDFDYSWECLKELKIQDPDLEDDEIAVASDYSFSVAKKILEELNRYLGDDFPYCSSTLESRGGINLVWDNITRKKRIWVRIPFTDKLKNSIYCREEEENKFIEDLSTEDMIETMIKLLLWLKPSSNTELNNLWW